MLSVISGALHHTVHTSTIQETPSDPTKGGTETVSSGPMKGATKRKKIISCSWNEIERS